MYAYDVKRHQKPHIHAYYGDDEAVFDIGNGALLRGRLPSAQTKRVQKWINARARELSAGWRLAMQGEQPPRIQPLQ